MDVLIPAGGRRLGIVALYLLVSIELTSLGRRYMKKSTWKYVHLSSYAMFLLASIHMATAGTDAGNPIVKLMLVFGVLEVAVLVGIRVLNPEAGKATTS